MQVRRKARLRQMRRIHTESILTSSPGNPWGAQGRIEPERTKSSVEEPGDLPVVVQTPAAVGTWEGQRFPHFVVPAHECLRGQASLLTVLLQQPEPYLRPIGFPYLSQPLQEAVCSGF